MSLIFVAIWLLFWGQQLYVGWTHTFTFTLPLSHLHWFYLRHRWISCHVCFHILWVKFIIYYLIFYLFFLYIFLSINAQWILIDKYYSDELLCFWEILQHHFHFLFSFFKRHWHWATIVRLKRSQTLLIRKTSMRSNCGRRVNNAWLSIRHAKLLRQ